MRVKTAVATVIGAAFIGLLFLWFGSSAGLGSLHISTDKDQYKFGEYVKITLKNDGMVPVKFSDSWYGISVKGFDVDVGLGSCLIGIDRTSSLWPTEVVERTWNQVNYCSGDSRMIQPGIYEVYSKDNGGAHTSHLIKIVETEGSKSYHKMSDRLFRYLAFNEIPKPNSGNPLLDENGRISAKAQLTDETFFELLPQNIELVDKWTYQNESYILFKIKPDEMFEFADNEFVKIVAFAKL